MGLNIEVGILADLKTNDAETYEFYKNQYDLINMHLSSAGMEKFAEPENIEVWSSQMFGYDGLHYLRRIAAHIQFGNKLPLPGDDKATDDPLINKYSRLAFKRTSILWRLFGAKAPTREFDHLMLHGDSEGYYLPLDFEWVQFPNKKLKVAGGMIGSSYTLLKELNRLAELLRIPGSLEADSEELRDAVESQGEGYEQWQKYGIESYTCVNLIRGAKKSIETGAALVFC